VHVCTLARTTLRLRCALRQNVIVISIPTVFDPNLAPPGKAVVHAYTAGCEPYDVWAGMDRASTEYKQLKQQRAEVLWKALERVIPVR
jgi:phytoene dehydrogenase-like protein